MKKRCEYKKAEMNLIPNTDITILLIDGVENSYHITPQDGYKLHAKELDTKGFDEEAQSETDEVVPGFTTGTKSCHIGYDFLLNPREFYTVLATE